MAGIATHYVPTENFAKLEEALTDTPANKVKEVIDTFAKPGNFPDKSSHSEIVSHKADISDCFEGKKSVEDIYASLENLVKSPVESSRKWAEKTLALLNQMSPTSLKVAGCFY